jgi:plastocyanin
MRTTKLVSAAVLSLLVVSLAACSSDAPASSSKSSSSSKADAPAVDDAPATSGGDPVFVSSAPDGSPAMSIGESAFDPKTLSIKAGDTVVFTSGDDKPHGLDAGSLASVTVAKGLPEYYQFPDAGSYTVKDDVQGFTATITVR